MILVTGAAGKTGRKVVEALASRGVDVRASVYREEQRKALLDLGASEVVVTQLTAPDQVDLAFEGMGRAYHLCPNMHADELGIGESVIRAARKHGLKKLVYHSVLRPQIESMPHHWQKMRVEEKLFESGLDFTILQPAPYLQNLLAGWDRIVSEGIYSVPYAARTRISMVDLVDVAEVAAKVSIEPGHGGAVYELVGPSAPDQAEVADALSEHLGREIRLEILDRQTWKHRASASGLGPYAVETLCAMFEYYERHHFVANDTVSTLLLGRRPTDLPSFLRRIEHRPSG